MQVELWMVIPFVIMLLTIAIAPLVAEHFWESNRNKLIFTRQFKRGNSRGHNEFESIVTNTHIVNNS